MWLESQQYVLLDSEKNNTEEQHHVGRTVKHSRALLAGILFSLVLNISLVVTYLQISSKISNCGRTVYGTFHLQRLEYTSLAKSYTANLGQDSTVAWKSKSAYFGEDEAIADRLWAEISIDNGTVALSDSYVEAMELPVSQRFPWDQEKGLYLLNGFHSMHCLVH